MYQYIEIFTQYQEIYLIDYFLQMAERYLLGENVDFQLTSKELQNSRRKIAAILINEAGKTDCFILCIICQFHLFYFSLLYAVDKLVEIRGKLVHVMLSGAILL